MVIAAHLSDVADSGLASTALFKTVMRVHRLEGQSCI